MLGASSLEAGKAYPDVACSEQTLVASLALLELIDAKP